MAKTTSTKRKYKKSKYAKPRKGPRQVGSVKSNRRVGGFNNVNLKHFDSYVDEVFHKSPETANSVIFSGAAATIKDMGSVEIAALNVPTIGNKPDSRDGREIMAHRIVVQGTIRVGGAIVAKNTTHNPEYFVALVRDKAPDGDGFAPNQVYVAAHELANGVATEPICQQNRASAARPVRNLNFLQRYDVLGTVKGVLNLDWLVGDKTSGAKVGTGRTVPFRIDKKLNFKCTYADDTQDAKALASNGLYLIAVCNTPAASSIIPVLSCNSRFYFSG